MSWVQADAHEAHAPGERSVAPHAIAQIGQRRVRERATQGIDAVCVKKSQQSDLASRERRKPNGAIRAVEQYGFRYALDPLQRVAARAVVARIPCGAPPPCPGPRQSSLKRLLRRAAPASIHDRSPRRPGASAHRCVPERCHPLRIGGELHVMGTAQPFFGEVDLERGGELMAVPMERP